MRGKKVPANYERVIILKNLIKAMSALCMAVILAGCNSNAPISQSTSALTESTPAESAPTENESAPVSSESTPDESTPEEDPDSTGQTAQSGGVAEKFRAPDKKTPDLSGATVATPDGQSISVSEMTEDNWMYVSTDDYVYLAVPQGVSYNSAENADIYDENAYSFSGAPDSITYEYKKYKVGDEICGLTVTYANTTFSMDLAGTYPDYFNGGSAQFEGELTLTGYCSIAPEDDGYTSKHDILFVPDAESCKIPIMNYPHGSEDSRLFRAMTGDFAWLTEYGAAITLGSADEHKELDFSAFPEDGTFIKAKVTINDIMVRDELNFTRNTKANIVDIEVL